MVGGHPGFAGYLSQAAGAALGRMSDKREKKNIKETSEGEITNFMEALQGYNYDYKKSSMGSGMVSEEDTKKKQTGVMAQELAKTAIGKRVVKKREIYDYPEPSKPKKKKERLYLDTGALASALAAGVGNLHQRVKDLEKKD